jgi:hypothetical protein
MSAHITKDVSLATMFFLINASSEAPLIRLPCPTAKTASRQDIGHSNR